MGTAQIALLLRPAVFVVALVVAGCSDESVTPSGDAGIVDAASDSGTTVLPDASGDGARPDGGPCAPSSCASTETSCATIPDGCGGSIRCAGCPDVSFDPQRQRHIELPEVVAGQPFDVPLRASVAPSVFDYDRFADRGTGPADPRAISLPGLSSIEATLTYDTTRGTLGGRMDQVGVHRFYVSVCTVAPFDETACRRNENRRLDLAHLPVMPTAGSLGDAPPRARHSTTFSEVAVPVQDVIEHYYGPSPPDADPPFLDDAPTLLAHPVETVGSSDLPAGKHPVIVFAHGNGYRWHWYERFATDLAARGFIVLVPQYPFLSGTCHTSQARVGQAEAALRWALEQTGNDASPLFGHVDPEKVVVMGHSWGGASVQWDMFRSGARMFVVLDPITMVQNVPEWRTCEPNLPPSRPITVPVLTMDTLASGFHTTQAEHRGFYGNQPHVYAMLDGAVHEDYLDVGDHPSSNPDVAPAASAITAELIERMAIRYLDDDLRGTSALFGAQALTHDRGVYPGDMHVASLRPTALEAFVLDGADLPWADLSAADVGAWPDNPMGGRRMSTFTESRVSWPTTAALQIERGFGGEYRERNEAYFRSPAFRELHLLQSAGTEAAYVEQLGTGDGFDAGAFSHLALELAVHTEPDPQHEPNQDVGLSLELEDASGASATLSADRGSPVTTSRRHRLSAFHFPLEAFTGVNRSRLAAIRLRFSAPDADRTVMLDDMRFTRSP